MALLVPDQHVAYIKKFVELPDDKIEAFLDALTKAGPKFNTADLSHQVSRDVKLPGALTEGIVLVLASIYLTRDRQNTPTETFVDQEVSVALKRANTFSGKNADSSMGKTPKVPDSRLIA